MENSFFVLGEATPFQQGSLKIQRLQLCTWDIASQNSYIEIGIEVKPGSIPPNSDYNIYFCAPWLNEKCIFTSLHEQFADAGNCKFIFNEVIKYPAPIDEDNRNGTIVTFEDSQRSPLVITPITAKFLPEGKSLRLSFCNKAKQNEAPYVRVLIQTTRETLAIVKTGIAKREFIFDIKINEKRNLPETVLTLKREKELKYADIEKVFCFHAVPMSYEIGFIDGKKLKNVRNLEAEAFRKYLPCLQGIKNENSIITFSKSEGEGGHAFFTIFTEETIGPSQIILAISTNIVCSLLFAIGSLRNSIKQSDPCLLKMIPGEFWAAIVLLIVCFIYFLYHRRRKK